MASLAERNTWMGGTRRTRMVAASGTGINETTVGPPREWRNWTMTAGADRPETAGIKLHQREDRVKTRSVRLPVLGAALVVLVLLAACGGGGDGNGDDGGTPTDAAPTEDSGAGDTGGDTAADKSKGVAKGEVTGDVSLTFDLGVAPPPLSTYDLDASHGAYLIFADSAGTEVLYLTISDGSSIVQYVKGEMGLIVGAGGCTFEIDELDGSHAKGSATCTGMTVLEGESAPRTADMTFTFEARK